jgi:hypothetical protein
LNIATRFVGWNHLTEKKSKKRRRKKLLTAKKNQAWRKTTALKIRLSKKKIIPFAEK